MNFEPCFVYVRLGRRVHSKSRTPVQLGLLLGQSGDSGDGVWGGAVLCSKLANQQIPGQTSGIFSGLILHA